MLGAISMMDNTPDWERFSKGLLSLNAM